MTDLLTGFTGHKIGKYVGRVGAGLVLTGMLGFSMPSTTAAQSVDVRVYDSHHKDYHNWDDHEDHAYRRYLAEQHYEYREYQKQNHRRQDAYWKWRHNHPD
jgi:hypothetical protein